MPFPKMATARPKLSLLQSTSQVYLSSSVVLRVCQAAADWRNRILYISFIKFARDAFTLFALLIFRLGTLVEIEAAGFHSNILSTTICLK